VLDSMFFKDEALFHLSRYIDSQGSRIQGAENSCAVYKLAHICQIFVFDAHCLKNEMWDHSCLKRHLLLLLLLLLLPPPPPPQGGMVVVAIPAKSMPMTTTNSHFIQNSSKTLTQILL